MNAAKARAKGGDVPRAEHELTLLKGGAALFPALVEAMDAARSEVMLETYIFDFTRSALTVAEALERAAARGVAVRVVVDGVGTGEIPPEWTRRWAAAGVRWRVFNPARGWRLLMPRGWRRLHRKLCVVDGRLAFCGGINLLDDFHDPNHGALDEPRLDFAVRVRGPLVDDVHHTMTRLWWRLQTARKLRQVDAEGALAAVRAVADAGVEEQTYSRRMGAGVRASLVLRDNFRFRRRIESVYRLAIAQARHEIVIANAYFVPGVTLQRALIRAARRGVKITLLLQGRYEYFMQFHASHAMYGPMLAAGIEIIEYETSFLHAKVAVMDTPHGALATVGSSNLDPFSLLLAREANVFVRDDGFAAELMTHLRHAIGQQGRRVAPGAHARRSLLTRAANWIAYAGMRLMIMIAGKRY
ncbi:cardiolipin synthase ClsB [Piscinibacter sp.]|uniref:cardiolipin synthase ClsB n=1 Tax=Piscinibacter sp. TaxID=1903157 RepID=UPI0039E2F6D3